MTGVARNSDYCGMVTEGLRKATAGCAVLALTATIALGQELPDPVAAAIDTVAAQCAAADGGTLDLRYGAVTPQPLLGIDMLGLHTGWILDEAHMTCSTLGSRFNCGTGGCPVHFVIGSSVTTFLAQGWRLTEMAGSTIVVLKVHGGACGVSGASACFEAITFDSSGRAHSVAAY